MKRGAKKTKAARRTTKAAPPPEITEMDAVVSANLRALRQERKLSLSQLANLAGVSRAMLCQIELGHSVPSINMVWRIARAFEVDLATLVEPPGPAPVIVQRRREAKLSTSADGRFRTRIVFSLGGPRRVEVLEAWLAPRAQHRLDAADRATHLIVTSGELALVLESQRFELATGDAIVLPEGRPVGVTNATDRDCWLYATRA